jgi:hypothetical protein
MSYFERQDEAPPEPQTETMQVQQPEMPPQTDALHEDQAGHGEGSPGARVRGLRDRVAKALQNFDHPRATHPSLESGAETPVPTPVFDAQTEEPHEVVAEVPPASQDARFPVGPLGYNRAAVDERIAELERELEEARSVTPAISITDEIERLGEQTASILVVAHDQAHETTRAAQEQADRCIADAAANAVAMTEKAKRQLQELDNETDAIWRERARLLDDAREVGLALIAMAEEALERFPEEVRGEDASQPRSWQPHPQAPQPLPPDA